MKWIFLVFTFLSFIEGYTQTLQLKGRIRCSNDQDNLSTSGAENVLVVPSAIPSESVLTSSDPPGYYIIDTKVNKEVLYDRSIKLYIVTNCKTCLTKSITTFISSDQITYNNDKPQVNLKTKYLESLCDSVEFPSIVADTVLLGFHYQEDRDITNHPWIASPALLNIFKVFVAMDDLPPTKPKPEPDSTVLERLFFDKMSNNEIRYGYFLLNSSFGNSSTAGFNFSPNRDFSESAFWNPSSIFLSHKKVNFSVTTNWRNQIKLSTFIKYKDKIGLSTGFLNSFQSEQRTIYISEMGNYDEINEVFELNEYAFFLSPSFLINNSLSVSVTGKLFKQKFDNHQVIERTREYRNGVVEFANYKIIPERQEFSAFDMDLSFLYSLNNSMNFGLNFMNLFNSSLIGSNFLKNENPRRIEQFSIGAGVSYQYHRFSFGSDILFYRNSIYNIALGINFIPFDRSLIQMSFSAKEMVYSVSFKYHRFKLSYIDSQRLLKLDSNSRGSFFIIHQPYLFSSFTFDF